MRYALFALWMLFCTITPAAAQLSINFGSPGVHIGINLGGYPTLERIPGYPVYYAPGVNSNYFFYDGLYWDFDGENWYESSWYNGPWYLVDPIDVPVFLLRVPVRYYRHAPAYFRGWRSDDAPRWGERWGQSWQSRRSGWDQWSRSSAPAPAPLPTYQRQYTGNRYPQGAQQAAIATQNYRYQPRDAVAQQHFAHQRTQAQSAPQQPAQQQPVQRQQRQAEQRQQQAAPPQQVQQQQPAARQPRQQAEQQQPAARQQRQEPPQQQSRQAEQRPQPVQARPQPPERAPQGRGEDKGKGEDRGKGEEKGKGEDKGQGRDKER